MKHAPTTSHNYLAKLEKLAAELGPDPTAIYVIDTLHDPWCDFLKGYYFCNCDPELKVKKRVGPLQS